MPIWKIRLVYQDGKSYINYISSCGSFSVDWSTCWPKMAKYGQKLTLSCTEMCHISESRDLNMME